MVSDLAKKGFNYFEKLTQQMSICKKAAAQLMAFLEDYTDISKKVDDIHTIEHEGDMVLHEIMGELNRSFITPIDREDIASLAIILDDITDSIEDVANLFDMLMITDVRPEAKEMTRMICESCDALDNAVADFQNFKSSKKLKEYIIQVNGIEEEGDRLHRSVIKNMFKTETDSLTIMKWKETYDILEEVLDSCEDAANLLDSLIIKNS